MTNLDIQPVRQATNRYVEALLADKIAAADKLDVSYGDLWRSIERLAMAGGKRLRPYLAHLSYQAFGGESSQSIVEAGVALELLHLSLLIHDDIIDRDTVRYGIKNISGQYQAIYDDETESIDEAKHYADGAAIMAGDLLLAEAHRLIARASSDRQVAASFDAAVFSVCGGELLDTEAAFRSRASSALTIAEHKTASYSFVAPLTIGALMAGAEARSVESMSTFATSLGIAYQLKDDLLGVFGDPALTGKSVVGDIREGKRTYIVEQFELLASQQQRNDMTAMFGVEGLDEASYQGAVDLLEASGARQATEQKLTELEAEALMAIDQLPVEDSYRQAMRSVVAICLQRDK